MVFATEHELEGWLIRVRTMLRWAVAAAAVGAIGLALPYLWKAKTLRAASDAALLGLLVPVSIVFLLVLPYLERCAGKRKRAATPPVADRPTRG